MLNFACEILSIGPLNIPKCHSRDICIVIIKFTSISALRAMFKIYFISAAKFTLRSRFNFAREIYMYIVTNFTSIPRHFNSVYIRIIIIINSLGPVNGCEL